MCDVILFRTKGAADSGIFFIYLLCFLVKQATQPLSKHSVYKCDSLSLDLDV